MQEMPDTQYKCKQCGQVLNSAEALREHEKTHAGQGQQPSGQQGEGGQTRGAGGGQSRE
jgi:hypothetical protein